MDKAVERACAVQRGRLVLGRVYVFKRGFEHYYAVSGRLPKYGDIHAKHKSERFLGIVKPVDFSAEHGVYYTEIL